MKSTKEKEWYLPKDLAGLGDLPLFPSNITRKARQEGWIKREAKGIKGGGFEYHYSSLPLNVQQALGFDTTTTNTQAKQKSTDELEQEIKQVKESVTNLIAILNTQSQASLSGLSDEENRLISLFRLCDKQKKNALISTAEDLVIKTLSNQKENSELSEDYKVA